MKNTARRHTVGAARHPRKCLDVSSLEAMLRDATVRRLGNQQKRPRVKAGHHAMASQPRAKPTTKTKRARFA